MTARLSRNVTCTRCQTTGTVFWSEGGWRDQDGRVTAIWGEFDSRRCGVEVSSLRFCAADVAGPSNLMVH
jgi:hypothetical protein